MGPVFFSLMRGRVVGGIDKWPVVIFLSGQVEKLQQAGVVSVNFMLDWLGIRPGRSGRCLLPAASLLLPSYIPFFSIAT